MKCPVCKIDMIVVEYKQIELDYCVRCTGVWFDSGELELLLDTMKTSGGSLSPGKLLHLTEAKVAEKTRRCPICGQKMRKATVGEEPKVLIDACPREEGLWFDGGELNQVVCQLAGMPSATADSEGIIPFLCDAFSASEKPSPQ